jgi:hypothetical protein
MVCCIKKFPLTAVESCGATAAEAAEVLNGVKVLNEASQSAGDEAAKQEDDFANNADLPEWKQRCIRNYVNCQQEGWTGDCHACLRYCEGQQDWPRDKCRERRGKREVSP